MLRYIVLLGLATAAWGHTTPVQRCNNNAPLPLNVHVEGCDNPPCGFPQLEDAVVHIVFRASNVMPNMRTRAVAYMGIVPLVYPLGDQANACRGLTNSRCPVVTGEVLQYTLRMHVESFMAVGTQVNLEFSVIDEDRSNTFICIRVPIRVDPPLLQ